MPDVTPAVMDALAALESRKTGRAAKADKASSDAAAAAKAKEDATASAADLERETQTLAAQVDSFKQLVDQTYRP